MSIIRPANTVTLLIVLAALLVPGVAAAAITQFENPLATSYPDVAITNILENIIKFILGLSALVAMTTLVYSGLRLILGASLSESEIARAKQMIFWAIIGLIVIGMAASILDVLDWVLFFTPGP